MRWNPRYVCYSQENGRTPKDQLRYDREKLLGGCMAEFIIWIGQRWGEWKTLTGFDERRSLLSEQDHQDFDNWLSQRQDKARR